MRRTRGPDDAPEVGGPCRAPRLRGLSMASGSPCVLRSPFLWNGETLEERLAGPGAGHAAALTAARALISRRRAWGLKSCILVCPHIRKFTSEVAIRAYSTLSVDRSNGKRALRGYASCGRVDRADQLEDCGSGP